MDALTRPAVLFLHGWGVGPQAYAEPLRRVAQLGCAVVAPAQPGFGRTAALGGDQCNFAGYAQWANAYLDELGVDQPVLVVGHSFGGGVAIQLAHDHPERVRAVVLCNPVGGTSGFRGAQSGALVDRPLWEWGRELGANLFALPAMARVLPSVLGEALPNIVQNPVALWRVGDFVRRANLVDEIAGVARQGLQVTVVWSDRDRLVPHASFKALCRAARVPGVVVPGSHSWMMVDSDRFADIVLRALVESGVVEEALAFSDAGRSTAGAADIA